MIDKTKELKELLVDKKILIVGAGVTGKALCKALDGYNLFITDDNEHKLEELSAKNTSSEVSVIKSAPDWTKDILNYDLVVPSPGVPKNHPIIQSAVSSSIKVVSEIEIAYLMANKPIIAITGTNGKTTVTTLVNEVLNRSNIKSVACGNIGTSLVEAVTTSTEVDFFVAEVSSFQLSFIKTFRPKVAAWINLTEDHLDWHSDLNEYATTKAKIWSNQTFDDIAVANTDDPVVRDHFTKLTSTNGSNDVGNSTGPRTVTFGLKGGNLYIADGKIVVYDLLEKHETKNLISVSDLNRSSTIDLLNYLAVLSICLPIGADLNAALGAIKEFKGLEHRLELVLNQNGVKWINDSKATTPSAVVGALESMEDVILILGGKDKGLDFTPILSKLSHINSFILIGELTDKIESLFSSYSKPIIKAESMKQAVKEAKEIASFGSTVLLSPGGASYDMYDSYRARGEDFKKEVFDQLNNSK